LNYKELIRISLLLISSPAKAWEEIRFEDKRKVHTEFVYPYLGIIALVTFLSLIFSYGWGEPLSYQLAMKECCSLLVSLFGGFYLASYAVHKYLVSVLGVEQDIVEAQQLTGYSLVVYFLLTLLLGIAPSFRVISWVIQIYTAYVVWEGLSALASEIDDNKRATATVWITVFVLLSPRLIYFVFDKLLHILN